MIGLAFIVAVQGCTAVAVGVVVKHRKNKKAEIATVEVAASADDLYDAELRVLEARSDASILSRNPDTRAIHAVVGDDRVNSTIRSVGAGKSELRVEAISQDSLEPSEAPAVDFEKRVLEQLDIHYTVEPMR
jgi:hypothetical protein